MKLSEAIRLGATMRPQTTDQWSTEGSCAISAAMEAVGISRVPISIYDGKMGIPYNEIADRWPLKMNTCPECGNNHGDQQWPHLSVIYHLNDVHKWTRERIADFVELHKGLIDREEPAGYHADCGDECGYIQQLKAGME
jgi:hypothetical protein